MPYEAFVLLPHAKFTLAGVARLLRARFVHRPDVRVLLGSIVRVKTSDGWVLKVWHNREPHVALESAQIAQALAAGDCTGASPKALERARAAGLESFPARLELLCGPDPDMAHFNDYLFALEAMQALEGSVAFDPSSSMFL